MPLSEMKWVILFRGGTYSDRKMLALLSRKESGQTKHARRSSVQNGHPWWLESGAAITIFRTIPSRLGLPQ